MEAILNSSFDWNGIREPFIVATENDCLNGVAHAVRPPAHRHGADLRRRAHLLEPGRGQARDRARARQAPAAGGIIHLINSGAAALDGTGQQQPRRPAGHEAVLGDHARGGAGLPGGHHLVARRSPSTSAAAASPRSYCTRGGMPVTMIRLNLVEGPGAGAADRRGLDRRPPREVHETLDERTNPTWPTTWFAPRLTGQGAVPRRLLGHEQLGRQPRRDQLRPHRRRPRSRWPRCCASRSPCTTSPRTRLFRPSAWTAFGADDPQGADFRACAAFGPLYGR